MDTDYAALTYTLPDGWANDRGLAGRAGPDAVDRLHGLRSRRRPRRGVARIVASATNPALERTDQADCTGAAVPSVANPSQDHSVAAFIDWLRAQPRIVVSTPTAITVGGRPGQWIDVKDRACLDRHRPRQNPDGTPAPIIFAPANGAVTGLGGTGTKASWRLVGPEQMRLVFVDLGQGHIVLVRVDATDPGRFENLAAARPCRSSSR